MASIKFGPLITDARGSVGGMVFSRSRSGPFVRARTSPAYDPTNKRIAYSSALAQVYRLWLNVLTSADRADWDALGAATTFTNALGQDFNPSGWNLFCRTNVLGIYFIGTYASVAPASAVGTLYVLDFSWSVPGQFVIAVDSDMPVNNDYVFFWLSPPLRQTVNTFRGPWLYDLSGIAYDYHGPGQVGPANAYESGDRVVIRYRYWRITGELSTDYFDTLDIP